MRHIIELEPSFAPAVAVIIISIVAIAYELKKTLKIIK